ncbi:MAG: sortase [Parcubacteria group bacterium]|jgi:LPXTG-site transpeptidase (sortase) family protein
MPNYWKKIQNSWIYSFLFSCFLLAIFLVLFYIANLDIFAKKNDIYQEQPISSLGSDEEIKKLLGSTYYSHMSYGEWAKYFSLNDNDKLDSDPDNDGLENYEEYIHGTDPVRADTDSDGFSDQQEIVNGYDPDAPGETKPVVEISISKINISAPMIWSLSENENGQLEDLKKGVSHFYKTAAPGQPGNAVISGHSSNYFWVEGNYNYIFKDLNNLENGDMIKIKTTQKNGRVIIYYYKVTDKFNTASDDNRIFENTDNPTLTLSTCWPLGTNLRRLIVKAEKLQ